MDHSAETTDNPSAGSTQRRTSLWRHHDFRQLWLGDSVSVFGFQFVGLAIPVLAVTVLDATPFQMGLLGTLEMLAFLLVGLPSGAWVDRWRKKRVIVVGDISRGALLLTLPLAWVAGLLTIWQLYLISFVVGCITVFFDVANQSYLPEILDGDQLAEGNAKLQATQSTAGIAGPSLAGGLIKLVGAPWTIAVTSVCMAASSLFVSRIRHVEDRPDPADRRPLREEIGEGLRFVAKHPLLWRITSCTGISNFAHTITQTLFVLFAIRTLGLDEATLGIILSSGAVGGILGAVTSDRFARLVGEGRSIPISAILFSLVSVATPLSAYVDNPVPLLIAGGVLGGWGVVVYNVVQVSFRQRLCPKPLLGRMNASVRFLVWGPIPIGAFLAGVLGESVGVVATMWIGVAVQALSALPVVLSPLVTMGALPRELDASRD